MGIINNIVGKTALGAIAIGATMALTPISAEAATIYASSADIIVDGPRGTSNDRDNINNAFGAGDGSFFELGFDAVVDFQFGTPTGQSFFGPGSVIEVTFGNADNFLEAVQIEVGIKGDESSFITADPNPFVNNSGSNSFTFSGIFDTVRLTDLTAILFPDSNSTNSSTGGFDVDAIGVSPVPVPAAGLLLIGSLGGLAALRRRRKSA